MLAQDLPAKYKIKSMTDIQTKAVQHLYDLSRLRKLNETKIMEDLFTTMDRGNAVLGLEVKQFFSELPECYEKTTYSTESENVHAKVKKIQALKAFYDLICQHPGEEEAIIAKLHMLSNVIIE